jgi:hypothetical protein
MNKINQFFAAHGSKVIAVLLVLVYFKSCSIDSEVTTLKKVTKENTEIINQLPTSKDVKIEGLNAEKRMIQATDRKILDVQRQNQIEAEIEVLKKSK